MFKRLKHRYDMHGFLTIEIIYTDDCCHDRIMFLRILPHLRTLPDVPALSDLPPFKLTVEPIFVTSVNDCVKACAEIQRAMEKAPESRRVVGLDTEWTPVFQLKARGGASVSALSPEARITTLQLSIMGENEDQESTYVFHIPSISGKPPDKWQFPLSLRTLLEARLVTFVGASIQQDVTRLHTQWDVNVANFEDVCQQAVARGAPGGRSLANVVAQVLHERLPKPASTRQSCWHEKLSKDQVMYAARDVAAVMRVYTRLNRPAKPLELGMQVQSSLT